MVTTETKGNEALRMEAEEYFGSEVAKPNSPKKAQKTHKKAITCGLWASDKFPKKFEHLLTVV